MHNINPSAWEYRSPEPDFPTRRSCRTRRPRQIESQQPSVDIETLTLTNAVLAISGRTILVAEQDPHVAEDICRAIEGYGGQPVGPLSSAAAALKVLARRKVDGAVLDVALADGPAEALLDHLVQSGVAVAVQTDADPPSWLAARYPGIPVFSKPSPTGRLFHRLIGSLDP
jgi:two-component system, response regulator PdtaR